jgi:hypothetical protein
VWLWHVEIVNRRDGEIEADAILIQDLGLGERGFCYFGERISAPLLPRAVSEVTLSGMPGTSFSEQHHVANGK